MKQVEKFKWYLPGRLGSKPYRSSWHMSEDEARAAGALRKDEHSRIVIEIAETAAERAEVMLRTDTSRSAADRRQDPK